MDRRDIAWCVNGKFLGRRSTGTERFARGIVLALDALLPPGADWTLVCPAGARPPPLRRIRVREAGPRGMPPHLWEQAVLPAASAGARLLNLGGSASWIAMPRSFCVIHDAAVFDHPAAYSRAFVAWYRALFRRAGRRAVGLATVSAFSRARLCAALGTPEARWAVVPNGAGHFDAVEAEPAALRRLGLEGRPYLLCVASANPTKNIDRLVAAFGRLGPADGDRAPRLVLAGGRNAAVFAEGRAAPDPAGVLRTGPVDDATLKALYLGATALACPSLYEGFGLPPLEAMSLGCPVVAARAASLPEVCGDAALYVDPDSVDDIAGGLRRILDEAALRARLVEAGRVRAGPMTWSAAAATLLEALDAVR